MLGDALLVAPVFNYEGIANYYLPAGKWTHLLSGKVLEGPRWLREKHDFMSLPLMVRPNSVIPVGAQADRPDYDYSDNLTLRVYQLESGSSVRVEIPSAKGNVETTFDINREENAIHIRRKGPPKAWKVLLVNVHSVQPGKNVKLTPEGTLLTPEKTENSLRINIIP